MSNKKKLEKLFYDAYKRNDRSLAAQVWELNQSLEKDGLTLEEIHDLHFDIWLDWMHSYEKQYKRLVEKTLLLDPDGDTWGSMIIAGNWYPYTKSRHIQQGRIIGDLQQEVGDLLDEIAKEEEKRFFYDIIPTPYM